jgi:hypothetical protein
MHVGAAVPSAVAEHHVDLVGFIQPHRDPGGEQVPQVDHFFARVLQGADHADADRPALAGEGGDRGLSPFAEVAFGLVGGQERQLIDHHDQEREHGRDGERPGPAAELARARVHLGDRGGSGQGRAVYDERSRAVSVRGGSQHAW